MNALDLAYINRLAPYKVWTENGRDYFVETKYDLKEILAEFDETISILTNKPSE